MVIVVMTKHEFLEHIENPFLLSEKTLSEYEKLVAKYPFCSTIWLLYLKNLQLVNDIRFDEMLKRGAVACPDRSKLFTLIHQQPESNIEKVEPAITEEKETKTETPEQEVKTEAQKPAKENKKENKEENEPIPELEKQYLAGAVNATILQEVSQLYEEPDTQKDLPEENQSIADEKVEEDIPVGEKLKEDEQHSFDEWIALLNHKKEQKESANQTVATPNKKNTIDEFDSLIAQFLEKEPKIVHKKKEFYSPVNAARLSVTEDPEIVTETLALIYMQQGDFNRALRAYEKLSLKYPEKSSYFASQIKIIKQKLNKK
ncbi:MAG TPA: hypothetical protein DIU39_09395 [Flavobacteriales bacterium]|nr:hypothetical protein [Flavobacteriales bacterium]